MIFFSLIRRICKLLNRKYVCYLDERELIKMIRFRKYKTIFLFGSPGHSNMGDQAQTYCIQKWLERNYVDYQLINLTLITSTERVINCIRKNIK